MADVHSLLIVALFIEEDDLGLGGHNLAGHALIRLGGLLFTFKFKFKFEFQIYYLHHSTIIYKLNIKFELISGKFNNNVFFSNHFDILDGVSGEDFIRAHGANAAGLRVHGQGSGEERGDGEQLHHLNCNLKWD